jgi:hypothetical protein
VSAQGVPEQINIQIASGDTVVVSWVTFEATRPRHPPRVEVVRGSGRRRDGAVPVSNASRSAATPIAVDNTDTISGVTHVHTTSGGRVYYMHFVRLSGLQERAPYTYTVQSGGVGATVSNEYTFRAPYTRGVTRINIFGDMGVYQWNNMECTAALRSFWTISRAFSSSAPTLHTPCAVFYLVHRRAGC